MGPEVWTKLGLNLFVILMSLAGEVDSLTLAQFLLEIIITTAVMDMFLNILSFQHAA